MASHTLLTLVLLTLYLGGEVLCAPLGEEPDQENATPQEAKEAVAVGEGAAEGEEGEVARGERCLGAVGSTRGSVQGLIGEAAKTKTPAERLQEFRNRVEAVRSLVVPPGLRVGQSLPPTPAPARVPPNSADLPLFGMPSSAGSVLGQPSPGSGSAPTLVVQQPILGQPQLAFPALAVNNQAILGQPQPAVAGSNQAILGQPHLAHVGTDQAILGQAAPAGVGLPNLIQSTLANVRAALSPQDGAKSSLPVSPFTNKQVAAALSIPEGIMNSTAAMLGAAQEAPANGNPGAGGILRPVRSDSPESNADEAAKQPTLTDVVNAAIAPIESSANRDESKQVENPPAIIPQSVIPYVPRIARPGLYIPGLSPGQEAVGS